jgi:hypothetical protein
MKDIQEVNTTINMIVGDRGEVLKNGFRNSKYSTSVKKTKQYIADLFKNLLDKNLIL